MRKKNGILTSAGVMGFCQFARADLIVNKSHFVMSTNATQTFAITVSDTGNSASQDIEGLDFTLQLLGSSNASAPYISSVDFLTNTIWTGLASNQSIASTYSNTSQSKPQYVSYLVLTNNAGEHLGGNSTTTLITGALVDVTFNTIGAKAQDYTLEMTGFTQPSDNSFFSDGNGNPVGNTAVDFPNLTLTVQTSVPEPTSTGLLGGMVMLALGRRPGRKI